MGYPTQGFNPTVPIAIDGGLNGLVGDVVGRKDDTAVAVADNVSSIIRYLKGIIAAIGAIPVGGDALEATSQLIKTQTDKLGDAGIGLAALEALVDDLEARLGTPAAGTVAGDVESIETKVGTNADVAGTTTLFARLRQIVDTYLADGTVGLAAIKAYVDCLPAALGDLVTKNLADILSDSTAFAGANIALIKTQTDKLGDATIGLAALKAYVDLIDDATNGLAAIKAEVEGLGGAAMRGTDGAALAVSWTAALATALGSYTAAKAAFLDVAISSRAAAATALSTATWTAALATALGSYTAARAGYLDNINQAGLLQVTAARAALLDQITAARLAELDAGNIPADTDPKVIGRTQIFEKSITSAANAGDVVVATVTTQPCLIESVVIHADAAQTANMTSCGIFGGAGKVVTFISAADAVQANLNAADKQVAWTGAVRLAATKTIVISLAGTGAAAVDLTIVVKYRACTGGGYLA